MPGLFWRIVRMGGLLGAGLCVLAVLLGWAIGENPTMRREVAGDPVQVGSSARLGGDAVWMIDPARSRPVEIRPAASGTLEYASMAPWVDLWGNRPVVGRWIDQPSLTGPPARFGLGRFERPDGPLAELIRVPSLPACPPAWGPVPSARFLYTGCDGHLYRIDLDAPPNSLARGPLQVALADDLAWGPPGGVQFLDLCWPPASALGGRLLAPIRIRVDSTLSQQIWWFRLDPRGLSIIDAGRLLAPGDSPDLQVQQPTLFHIPGRDPLLAYLAKDLDDPAWQVRVAPVRPDPETRAPRADPRDSTLLATGACLGPIRFTLRGDRLQFLARRPNDRPDDAARFASVPVERPTTPEGGELARGGDLSAGRPGPGSTDQPAGFSSAAGVGAGTDSPLVPLSASLITTSSRMALSPTLP
jgi:hypothetical protein